VSKLVAPPLAIYAHMPWCVRKCPYCDFNSHVAPESLPQESYIDCLLGDLEQDLPAVAGREVQSIFFGGGTPSLFAPQEIKRFLGIVRDRVPVATDMEVTLEANPGTIEHGRFGEYREAGVTRISLGVQSFNERHLKVLGRIHGRQHAIDAASELPGAGFDNFNLDLMYGLPAQSIEEALADIDRALELAPTHLSHYQLTLEPGTVFYHQPPTLPDEDILWEMQTACQEKIAVAGYQQYEVSAYARTGFQCRHNRNYWQFGDYLGLGAGAHGKWTDIDAQKIYRSERLRQPREYLRAESSLRRIATLRSIPSDELSFEFMLNALRLNEGFAEELFELRSGLDLGSIDSALQRARQLGLLEKTETRAWRPTALGRRFLNDLQALFLTEKEGVVSTLTRSLSTQT